MLTFFLASLITGEYNKHMNSRLRRLLPSYFKRNISSDAKNLSLLQSARELIETFFSILLLFFMTIFFILVNQIHKDYEKLEGKPNESVKSR